MRPGGGSSRCPLRRPFSLGLLLGFGCKERAAWWARITRVQVVIDPHFRPPTEQAARVAGRASHFGIGVYPDCRLGAGGNRWRWPPLFCVPVRLLHLKRRRDRKDL